MATNLSNIDNIPAGVQGMNAASINGQQAQGQARAPPSAAATDDIPKTASEAPLEGLQPGEGVSFADQVKGHAKMFAGKVFNNDAEVKQGAERITGADAA